MRDQRVIEKELPDIIWERENMEILSDFNPFLLSAIKMKAFYDKYS